MAGYMQKYERVLNALKESDHRLNQKIFNDTDDAFLIVEIVYDETGKPIDGIIKKANKNVSKLLNKKTEVFITKRMREAFPTTEALVCRVDQVLQTGKASRRPDYHESRITVLTFSAFLTVKGKSGNHRELTTSMMLDQYKSFRH